MPDNDIPDRSPSSEETRVPGTADNPGAGGEQEDKLKDYEVLFDRFQKKGPFWTSLLGKSWPAYDRDAKLNVQITLLPRALTRNEWVRKRMAEEVDVISTLRDKSIVKVLDFFTDAEDAFLIEEFVDGEDLATLMQRDERGARKNSEAIALDILRALGIAHTAGILHMDLRPEHVFVDGEGRTKVRGFSVARILRDQQTTLQREMKDKVKTLAYSSPEDLLNRGLDHRSDLYSLGCLLHRIHTGSPPFTEENVAYAHVHNAPVSPSEIDPAIPEAMESVILTCLAKDPEERFQSAAEIRSMFEQTVHESEEKIRKRLNPAIPLVSIVALIVALAGAVIFFGSREGKKSESMSGTFAHASTSRLEPVVGTGSALSDTRGETDGKKAAAGDKPAEASPTRPGSGKEGPPKSEPVKKGKPTAVVRSSGPEPEPAAKAKSKKPVEASQAPSRPIKEEPPESEPVEQGEDEPDAEPEDEYLSQMKKADGLVAGRKFAEAVATYKAAGKIREDSTEVQEKISGVYLAWGDALAETGQLQDAQKTYRIGLRYGEAPRERLLAIRDQIAEKLNEGLTVTLDPPGPVIDTGACRVWVTHKDHAILSVTVNKVGAEVVRTGCYARDFTDLEDGDHSIEIEVVDAAGNRAVRALSVEVDTRPPKIVSFSPGEGGELAGPRVVIRGQADEPIRSVWSEPKGPDAVIKGNVFTLELPVTGLFPRVRFGVLDRVGHRSEEITVSLYNPTYLPPGIEKRGGSFFSPRDGSFMVRVPGVEFILRDDRGRPEIQRTYTFYADVTEVTNAQYRRFLEWVDKSSNPREFAHPTQPPDKDYTPAFWKDDVLSADDKPVVGVDWWDAYAYARWAGKSLIPDAEWVVAARGVPEAVYPWGDAAPEPTHANYLVDPPRGPMPVKSFSRGRSPFGCYDMAGNVMEWCLDVYPDEGKRLVRGGSWFHSPRFMSISKRVGFPPGLRTKFIGLRCARFLIPEDGIEVE